MLKEAIRRIADKENLTESHAYEAMNEIMKGEGTHSQIGAFLMGMRIKGETIDEITGCARAMRDNATPLPLKSEYVIDTCGTGGDGGKTFNISTAVAIIAAAGGVKVAKHGNRAVSSRSGSADVLYELGFNIDMEHKRLASCIDEKGMAFLFAPKFHSAMKNVAAPRQELGTRTIFNILGPLTNPASVRGQVLGVYDKALVEPMAKVLLKLGCEKALVVHGDDGLDELTTTSFSNVCEVIDGRVINYRIEPEEFGIIRTMQADIQGGNAKDNSEIIKSILKGEKGPKRDIVVLNSAAALYVGKACESIREGIELAEKLIDSKSAYMKMQELVNYSRGVKA